MLPALVRISLPVCAPTLLISKVPLPDKIPPSVTVKPGATAIKDSPDKLKLVLSSRSVKKVTTPLLLTIQLPPAVTLRLLAPSVKVAPKLEPVVVSPFTDSVGVPARLPVQLRGTIGANEGENPVVVTPILLLAVI